MENIPGHGTTLPFRQYFSGNGTHRGEFDMSVLGLAGTILAGDVR